MVQLLTPVVEQCDTRVAALLQAQKALMAQIDLFSAGGYLRVECLQASTLHLCVYIEAILTLVPHTELAKAEEAKDGEYPDALLGAYAAKLLASRKKLKKV
jgi:hypothetical protein